MPNENWRRAEKNKSRRRGILAVCIVLNLYVVNTGAAWDLSCRNRGRFVPNVGILRQNIHNVQAWVDKQCIFLIDIQPWLCQTEAGKL